MYADSVETPPSLLETDSSALQPKAFRKPERRAARGNRPIRDVRAQATVTPRKRRGNGRSTVAEHLRSNATPRKVTVAEEMPLFDATIPRNDAHSKISHEPKYAISGAEPSWHRKRSAEIAAINAAKRNNVTFDPSSARLPGIATPKHLISRRGGKRSSVSKIEWLTLYRSAKEQLNYARLNFRNLKRQEKAAIRKKDFAAAGILQVEAKAAKRALAAARREFRVCARNPRACVAQNNRATRQEEREFLYGKPKPPALAKIPAGVRIKEPNKNKLIEYTGEKQPRRRKSRGKKKTRNIKKILKRLFKNDPSETNDDTWQFFPVAAARS